MKKSIHTTLSIEDFNYLEKIQKTNNCNLNTAINITIQRAKELNIVIEKKILDEVIEEVLHRYLRMINK